MFWNIAIKATVKNVKSARNGGRGADRKETV
jgi:hypothetical protein